jgi:3-hydroxybutyryl-CoA dehydratase
MTQIRKKAIEGLRVGDMFSVSRTFMEEDTTSFANITKDYNPIHFDDRFVKVKGLNNRICHGLLVAGMITEIGGQLGCLASEMSFDFKKPVYFKDTIECRLTITDLDDKGWINSTAEYKNQNGTLVIKGFLKGIVPDFKTREVMKMMVAEGDPTNKLN